MLKPKKFVFVTVLLILFNGILFSQNHQFSVSGTIVDSLNNERIEYASVVIYSLPEMDLISGTVTNSKGEFIITKLNQGEYALKLSFVGYLTKLVSIEIIDSSLKFSTPLLMQESSHLLHEVQISSAQDDKQTSIEKVRINVSQSISAVSGNATDILKNQPAVSIDPEDNIYLRGNKNILILLDGIPTTLTTLNSIPASGIAAIEIITNPDVKYDAEGTGGIINIVTVKRSNAGFSSTATLNYGFTDRINGGLNVSFKQGIWDIGLDYSGKYEENEIRSTLNRLLYAENIKVEQEIGSRQRNSTQKAGLNIIVKPGKNDLLSGSIKFVKPDLVNSQQISGTQVNDTFPPVYYYRLNEITYSRKSFESVLSYKHSFIPGKHEISISGSYSKTKGNRPADYYIEGQLLQKSSGGGAPTNAAIQADYTRTFFSSGKLEAGLKGFTRWNSFKYNFYDLDSTTNEWILEPAFSNDLDHRENIYSGYAMYSDSLLKHYYFKFGARLEFSTSELIQRSVPDTVSKTYLFPFPYLLIKRNLNKNQSIALTFNSRITRPTYPQLNPYINVIDETTYETGNKNLDPERLYKTELNYSFLKEKIQFTANLYGSATSDFITQVTRLLPPDTLILTYVNGKSAYKTGGEFDFTYIFNKYFSINTALSAFYTKTTGRVDEIDLETEDLAWTGNLKAIFKPDQKTELQLFLNYNSPVSLPQFVLDEIFYTDISVRRNFFNKQLTVSLTLTDVFNSSDWNIETNNTTYYLTNHSKSSTRILWLGLSFNFNSNNGKKTQKGVEDEEDKMKIRIGQS